MVEHTWLNFQDHFTRAQQNLRRVRGPSMQSNIMINQANAISQSLMQNMQEEKDVFMDAVEASETRILKAFATITPSPPTDDNSTGSATANKTASDMMMIGILKLLKELKNDKDDKKRKSPSTGQPRGRRNNNNSDNNNQQRKKYKRNDTSKYCWSHGACSHSSKDCEKKKDCHKVDATFQNMMGGCTDYCQMCT